MTLKQQEPDEVVEINNGVSLRHSGHTITIKSNTSYDCEIDIDGFSFILSNDLLVSFSNVLERIINA